MHDEESSRQQLEIRKKNLAILEAQAARHGTDVPLQLQNAMDYENEQIKVLEKAIDAYSAGQLGDVSPSLPDEIEMTPDTSPSSSYTAQMQAQISKLQGDIGDFRTVVLVKLATIEADVRQIRDEQERMRNDMAEINEERRQRLQPGSMTAIGVVVAIVMAAILFTILLSASGRL